MIKLVLAVLTVLFLNGVSGCAQDSLYLQGRSCAFGVYDQHLDTSVVEDEIVDEGDEPEEEDTRVDHEEEEEIDPAVGVSRHEAEQI